MDITSVPPPLPHVQAPAPQGSAAPAVREATVLPKSQTVQDVPDPSLVKERPKNMEAAQQATDEARYETVKKAAQMFKDVYAVRDTKFTIFKDNSGQYITRFTNLRDGKVTYIPEPEIMQYLESMGSYREAVVKIEA